MEFLILVNVLKKEKKKINFSLAVSLETKCASFAVADFSEGEEKGEEIHFEVCQKRKPRGSLNDAIRGNQTDTETLGGRGGRREEQTKWAVRHVA